MKLSEMKNEIIPIPTPGASSISTRVDSINFDMDCLTIAISSPDWDVEIKFPQIYGFRVLDELDLTEFEIPLSKGWLYEIKSGGWKDLELTRDSFRSGNLPWIREYVVAGMHQCVFVLTKEDPVISYKES